MQMKHLIFFVLIAFSLSFMASCDSSEVMEGVDNGGIFVTNASENELNVKSTETLKVEYKLFPREGTTANNYNQVTFSSSDPSIFEVNSEGVITGMKNGTARLIISASSPATDGSKEYTVMGSCVVRVTGQVRVQKIELDPSIEEIRINVNESAEFQIKPSYFTVYPDNALIKDVVFASSNSDIAYVEPNGLIRAVSGGVVTISIMSTDGSNVKAEMTVKVLAPVFTWYLEERRSFEFDYEPGLIKYPLNADGAYGNDWNLLIDEGSVWQASFISMSKPGRAMAPGATVGDIFIPVDMKQTLKFNQIFLRHRSTNTFARLRIWEFDLLGSDNGTDFYPLEEGIIVPGAKIDGAANVDATILLNNTYTKRYIRIVPVDWDKSAGNTMQVSDLKIGYDESRDPDFGK